MDALKLYEDALDDLASDLITEDEFTKIIKCLRNVQEVKHGHWNIEKIGVKNYKGTCSICGLYYEDEPRQILTFSDMEYCPRCGAKMEVEE